LREDIRPYYYHILILTGLFFTLLFIINTLSGRAALNSLSLYLPGFKDYIHNHLGDLWSLILITAIYRLLKKFSRLDFVFVVLGTIILLFSQSRSAYMGFGLGLVYLFITFKNLHKIKKWLYLGLVLFTLLFLYSSISKPILGSRPYYQQAILAIYDHPLIGTGVGSFGAITKDPKYDRIYDHANVVHNIILEMLLGLGIMGVIFCIWVFKIYRLNLKKNQPKNIILNLSLIVLGVNFFFDYTYVIPTMLWLWFIALGLGED
jgi:hypothetical protein